MTGSSEVRSSVLVTGLPILLHSDRILMNCHRMIMQGEEDIAVREAVKSKITPHNVRWLCRLSGATKVWLTLKDLIPKGAVTLSVAMWASRWEHWPVIHTPWAAAGLTR